MTYLQASILGIVQGFTEFLPISSTGHLILTGSLFEIVQTDFVKSFEIAIQLGSIFAVLALYFKKFTNLGILKKIIMAFIPTGILGLIFYAIVKKFLLGNSIVVLWTLFIGGVLLIIFELLHKEPKNAKKGIEEINYKEAIIIGCAQSVAMVPGVSRSAATILGGLVQKISRQAIVEFSFLLAVPTMLAATLLDLSKNAGNLSGSEINLLIFGFIVSFFVAILGIKFLLAAVKKTSFIPFGIYRIILAVFFWIFVFNW